MALPAPVQPSIADIIAAGTKFGPDAGLAIQRSQYLANALQALQADSGSIRTPLGLGANLLADGITQWSKNKADKEAMTAYGAARGAQDAGIINGLQSPANANSPVVPPPQADPGAAPDPTPVPPSAVAPDPSPASIPSGAGVIPGASAPAAATPGPTPEQIKLAQMVWGEARGEPPEGQQAVAAVAMNRARKSGQPLADILDAPNQFEGLTAKARAQTPDKLAAILANIAPELNGADPTGGATNFYAPALQAQLGRPAPSWATGPSQTIGHQQFFGGNPQALQMASAAPPPQPAASAAPQGIPPGSPAVGPQPYQVASNGPTPGPPQSIAPPPPAPIPQAGAPPAAPSSPGPPAAGGVAPVAPQAGQPLPNAPPMPQAQPQGPPTGPAPNPAEMTHLRQLLASPMTHDEGVAYGESLRRRMVTPLEAPKNMMWGPNGQAVPIPGTTYTQLQGQSPSDAVQVDPFHQVTHSAIPGKQGGVPEGKMFDPTTGSYVAIQGGQPRQLLTPQERAAAGISPADRAGYAMGADGKTFQTAPDPFGPKDQLAYSAQVQGMEPYKDYTQSRGFLATMKNLMTQPGGFADLGLIENAGKTINPTIAIRPNMIEQYGKEVGFPDWLTGEVSSVMNHGGHLTAQGRNALVNIAQANVQSHWDQLQPILKKVDHDAARYGVTREDILPDLVPMASTPPPAYPGAAVPGSPQAGVPQPGSVQSPGGAPPPRTAGMAAGPGPQPVPVRTPAEARQLPHGTPIRLPDGSIGRVP